ncbi:MAG: hypothetical protein GXO87_14835 [Chlorobi bacterium]|nr:hypothetical protein [Chlorobiota bacterium]
MKRRYFLLIFIALVFSAAYKIETGENVPKILLWNNVLIKSSPTNGSITLYNVNNPSNPSEVSEILIRANGDVAIKYRYLYADSFHDLITYDLSDISSPTAIDTIKNVFKTYYDPWMGGGVMGTTTGCLGCEQTMVTDAAPGATAGSLSRFAIVDDYLYCIDQNTLHLLDISNPAKPKKLNDIYINWNVETLYPNGDYLFVGSRNGMYIFSIEDRANPVQVSEFFHLTSCDPVFVEDSAAYVTLREGTVCQGFLNELDIIDISDIETPQLTNAVDMTYPYGLSVKNKIAYICEGSNGLTILDASNPNSPDTLSRYKDGTFFDAVLSDTLLYITGENGISILSVANPSQPKLLNKI